METSGPGPSGETIDTPRHRALGSASRAEILKLVSAQSGLTGAEISAHTGLHLSTVQAHLDRLVAAGLLVRARASAGAPGRPPWRYRVAAPVPAPPPYRALAQALVDHLATSGGGTPAAIAAGRAWGRRLAADTTAPGTAPGPAGTAVRAAASPPVRATDSPPVRAAETVIEVLRRLGFDPRQAGAGGSDAGRAEVHLHTCPFLELVGEHPDVMCGLHAGLVQGALRAAGAPDGQAVLEPFATPDACVVRLRVPDREDRRS